MANIDKKSFRDLQAGWAGDEGHTRLSLNILRQPAPISLSNVWRVGNQEIDNSGHLAGDSIKHVTLEPLDDQVIGHTVGLRHLEGGFGHISADHSSRRKGSLQRESQRPRSCTEVDRDQRRRPLGHQFEQVLGLGARDQHTLINRHLHRAEGDSSLEILERLTAAPPSNEVIQSILLGRRQLSPPPYLGPTTASDHRH